MSPRTLRRGLTAATALIVVAGAMAGCAQQSGSSDALDPDHPEKVSIQFGWLPNVENAATILAQQKGYFRAAGMDVTILPGGPNVTVTAPVVSGKALIGLMSSETLADATRQGADLVAVAATYQTSSSCIVSLDGAVRKPQDLVGKRFAFGQSDAATLTPFLEHVGVDESTITKVTSSDAVAALTSKQADAGFCTIANQPVALRDKGYDPTVIKLADYGYNRWSGLFVVRKDSLTDPDKKAEVVAALKAIAKGQRYALREPEAAAMTVYDAYGKKIGVTEQSQAEGLAAWNALIQESSDTPLEVTDEGIASQQDFFGVAGIDATASKLFDTSLNGQVFGDDAR
jgi:NitT/TauT family transport system substrate-binding protein